MEEISNSGNTNKPKNRIYYITKILRDNNIYFVIQRFDSKTKHFIGKNNVIKILDDYNLIAIGEKRLDNEEMKQDLSNSSNEDNDHSYEEKEKYQDNSKATLEI